MIVLHVARARTDSINIRGSLCKTRAALWITDATFLYFSRCNAHTPFTLFPFLRLSCFLLSFPSRYFPFTIFPYPPVVVLRFSLSRAYAPCCYFSLPFAHAISFFLFFILDSPTIPCPLVKQMKNRHSQTVSSTRIVTFSAEMETIPVSYSLLLRETELWIIH